MGWAEEFKRKGGGQVLRKVSIPNCKKQREGLSGRVRTHNLEKCGDNKKKKMTNVGRRKNGVYTWNIGDQSLENRDKWATEVSLTYGGMNIFGL
ncbi:hypothetical protein BVRB_005100 [Beta vulgaris subsp. vulgaris]|uniref:Uncharacterized protein n=1 Tax=Beta vulgaris subsp. vulgaris TaxID=3555 RepID=A0A0J8B739_BETVV|nr:hypothetical protein BVRB_005100 [Beta vulgaris subsp. vulgaris]